MIATPTALLVCGIWPFCWSPLMPGFYRSADLYIAIPAPGISVSVGGGIGTSPKNHLRSGTREDHSPSKVINRRTIIIPGFVPALPVPAYWRVRGNGWEVTP